MKSLRMRITLTLSILVAVACALALGTSAILRAGRDLVGEASPRVMMFGMALRDVALIAGFVAALLMAVLAVTWSTTRPVLDLTRAAQEIARGILTCRCTSPAGPRSFWSWRRPSR